LRAVPVPWYTEGTVPWSTAGTQRGKGEHVADHTHGGEQDGQTADGAGNLGSAPPSSEHVVPPAPSGVVPPEPTGVVPPAPATAAVAPAAAPTAPPPHPGGGAPQAPTHAPA